MMYSPPPMIGTPFTLLSGLPKFVSQVHILGGHQSRGWHKEFTLASVTSEAVRITDKDETWKLSDDMGHIDSVWTELTAVEGYGWR